MLLPKLVSIRKTPETSLNPSSLISLCWKTWNSPILLCIGDCCWITYRPTDQVIINFYLCCCRHKLQYYHVRLISLYILQSRINYWMNDISVWTIYLHAHSKKIWPHCNLKINSKSLYRIQDMYYYYLLFFTWHNGPVKC